MSMQIKEISKEVFQWAIISILTFISGGVISIYRKVDTIELVQQYNTQQIESNTRELQLRSEFMKRTDMDIQQLGQRVGLHERLCQDLKTIK